MPRPVPRASPFLLAWMTLSIVVAQLTGVMSPTRFTAFVVHQLVLLIALGVTSLGMWRGTCGPLRWGPTWWWGLGGIGIALLAAVLGLRPGFSGLFAMLYWGSLFGWGLVFLCWAHRWPHLWRRAWLLSTLLALVLAFGEMGLWWAQGWSVRGPWIPPLGYRLRSIMGWGNPNLSAPPFLFLTFMALYEGTLAPRRQRGWLGVAILALTGLLMTGSRGGWLGLLAGGFVLAWGFRRDLARWWRTAPLHTRLGGVLVTIGVIWVGWYGFPHLVAWLRGPWEPAKWTPVPLLRRPQLWQAAWQAGWMHPWSGIGPGNFGLWLVQQYSVPPQTLYTHAHNLALHLWAEYGSVGVLFVLLGGVLTWRMLRQSRSAFTPQTHFLLAVFGAWLVQGLVEACFFVWFACGILGWAAWSMFLTSLHVPDTPARPRQTPKVWLGLLVWLGLMSGAFWRVGAFWPTVERAAQASTWAQAAREFARAAERSPTAFEHFAAGQAFARAAWQNARVPSASSWGTYGEPALLEQAAFHYTQGLAREPWYALPWANLGILYWHQGNPSAALAAMHQAIQRAPAYAPLHVWLGWMYEQRGATEAATQAYRQALALDPALEASTFFAQPSPARTDALQQSQDVRAAFHELTNADPCARGWQWLYQQRIARADAAFAACPTHQRYLGEALVGLYRGWTPLQVTRYGRLARDATARQWMDYYGLQGEFWFARERCDLALPAYEQAFEYARALAQGDDVVWMYAVYVLQYGDLGKPLVPGGPPLYPNYVVTRFAPHYLKCQTTAAAGPIIPSMDPGR